MIGRDPQCWGNWMFTLGSLFPLEKSQALVWGVGDGEEGVCVCGHLPAALCQPGRGVMQLECSCSSCSSNAVLLSLCGPQGCFGLTALFTDFHSGILCMDSCYLVFLWGELKSGTPMPPSWWHYLLLSGHWCLNLISSLCSFRRD